MPSTAAKPVRLTIPAEVHAFAQERGLGPHLPGIFEVLHRVFADATRIRVELHQDPEIPDLRWILFEPEVPWETSEESLQATAAWHDGTGAVCPKPLLSEFALVVRRRPA
jgi:hypothetical protein